MLWVKKIFFALTKDERSIFSLSLGVATLSIIFLVGASVRASTQIIPASGGTFTEGMVGQPSYINPVLASTNTDKALVRLLFSNLKDISDKVEMNNNGKEWRVRLKENVFWSDGERITADDVIFTLEKIKDTNTGSPLLGSWQGVSAKRGSQLEVVFELANPYSFFEENISNLYIIPKHLFDEVPSINWRLSEYNLKPVGSGPFAYDTYSKREDGFITKYSLKRNEKYFGNKAFLDSFQINFFSTPEEVIKNFNSGKVDGVGDLDPRNLKLIRRPYKSFGFEIPNYYAVFINQSEKIPLQEKEVRTALSQSIDRDNLINTVFGGRAKPVWGPIPPSFNLNLDQTNTTSSEARANEILENADWKKNFEGMREKTSGTTIIPMELTLTVPRLPFLVETANQIKGSWEKLGIRVNIQEVSPGGELDQIIKNRNYEMILLGNALSSGPDLFSFWHSSERFHPGLNLSIYNNREVDGLIESIRHDFDGDSRKSQLQKLQDTITKDYPAIFLYSPNYIYATGKILKGVEAGPISEATNRFLQAEKWYVKNARTLK